MPRAHYFKIFLFHLLAAVIASATCYAQSGTINGKVVNEYGKGLQGITVTNKTNNNASITDAEGNFNISGTPGQVLVFTGFAYNAAQVKIGTQKGLDVRLTPKYLNAFPVSAAAVNAGDTIQVPLPQARTGGVLYGIGNRINELGAVSTIYSNQINTTPASQYTYALPGRLAGLSVNQTAGFYTPATSPLTDVDIFVGNIPKNNSGAGPTDNTEFNIQLRGHAASLGQNPLTIVDGVQRDYYSLDPETIESVTVLKDALSTVLLGQNSSRGAIIVNTLQPKAGPPSVSFTAESGIQQILNTPTLLPAYQYAYLLNEALLNDGKTPAYTSADFDAYRNHTDPIGHPDVNWFNTILKDNPFISRYNLNVTGGNSVAKYIVALNYMDQNGIFRTDDANSYNTNDQLKRYSINSKILVDVNKNFNIGLSLFGRLMEGNQPGAHSSTILNTLLTTPNNAYPVYNNDGSFGGNVSYTQNLLAQTISSGYIRDNTRDITANLDLNYKLDNWVKGLWVKANGNVSVNSSSILDRSKQAPVFSQIKSSAGDTSYNRYGSTVNQLNNFTSTAWARYWFAQLSAGYDRQFGDHTVSAMLLYDQKKTLLNYDIPSYLTNYGARVSYDFQKKYFAEVAGNYGGYNRFQPGHQYGLFYAGGLGWDIAQENFIKNNAKWINQLKLRGTYGKTGNANVDYYGYYIYRSYFQDIAGTYPIGSSYPNSIGLGEGPLANVDATWEKANKLDIGLDVALFNNHFTLNADYYNEKYYDVLQQRGKTIALLGSNYPIENVGKDRYYGGELNITYQNNVKNFNYFITGNAAIQQSKVLFMDEQYQPYAYNMHTGKPVGQRFGFIADGLYQTADEVAQGATISGYTLHVGDVKYKDLNGDGVIDQFDQAPIGKMRPIIYFGLNAGFSLKGFDVSVLLQGAANRDLYVDNSAIDQGLLSQNNSYSQLYEQVLGRWTPETAAYATSPRLTAGGNGYNYSPAFLSSSYFLHNGNYVRLKNVSIAYNLPYSLIKGLKVGSIKLFVNAQNLLTFAGYDGVDPEVQWPSYPVQRVLNAGINIKL